jgi:hypothetical protein
MEIPHYPISGNGDYFFILGTVSLELLRFQTWLSLGVGCDSGLSTNILSTTTTDHTQRIAYEPVSNLYVQV